MIPVIVAVLAALAVAVLTPVGDRLREVFFPTKASVSGSIELRGQPVAGARVVLDDGQSVNADAGGAFLLDSVGIGRHRLQIEALGAQSRATEFSVQRGATELNIGPIALDPLVELGFFATVGPPRLGSVDPSTATVDYDLTFWIHGSPAVLQRVASVSYTLPAPLPATSVRGRPARGFCYRQVGRLLFQELLTSGTFDVVTAVVDLGDGRPFQIQASPGGGQRPDCPATSAPTVKGSEPQPAPPTVPPRPTPPVLPPPTTPEEPEPEPAPTPIPTVMVTVPDVTGASVEDAIDKLKHFCATNRRPDDPPCLTAKVTPSDAPLDEIVTGQEPDPGTELELGSEVELFTS